MNFIMNAISVASTADAAYILLYVLISVRNATDVVMDKKIMTISRGSRKRMGFPRKMIQIPLSTARKIRSSLLNRTKTEIPARVANWLVVTALVGHVFSNCESL